MLRRFLPIVLASLLAVGILAGYTVAFAQGPDPTGTVETGDEGLRKAVNFT